MGRATGKKNFPTDLAIRTLWVPNRIPNNKYTKKKRGITERTQLSPLSWLTANFARENSNRAIYFSYIFWAKNNKLVLKVPYGQSLWSVCSHLFPYRFLCVLCWHLSIYHAVVSNQSPKVHHFISQISWPKSLPNANLIPVAQNSNAKSLFLI